MSQIPVPCRSSAAEGLRILAAGDSWLPETDDTGCSGSACSLLGYISSGDTQRVLSRLVTVHTPILALLVYSHPRLETSQQMEKLWGPRSAHSLCAAKARCLQEDRGRSIPACPHM